MTEKNTTSARAIDRADKLKSHLLSVLEASQLHGESLSDSVRYSMDNYCSNDLDRLNAVTVNKPVKFANFDGEWFVPENSDSERRILFIHGGGWMSGSVDVYRHLIADIAVQSACPVLAINYRLAPEHKYPAGLNDCVEAYRYLCDNSPEGKHSAQEITVIGDSCGGNLSAVTTLHAIGNNFRVPDKLVLLSPVLDVSGQADEPKGVDDMVVSMEGMKIITEHYLETEQISLREDSNVSPLKMDDSSLAKFPNVLLQVGAEEYLRDESLTFAKRLWEQGRTTKLSVWPHMPHVFQLFAKELPEARDSIREICQFIRD